MEVFLHAWRRIETALAVALIVVSLTYAGMVATAMATHSLSTDEFGTVGTFSAKGPLRVLTDYRAPKNHIFFNLLNSLLPDRKSLDPARTRALSILATLLTLGVIVGYAARRGQLLEGAVVAALAAFAPELLSLSMEARGYGFLGLFAVLAAVSTLEYLRTDRHAWLVALGAASVLGVYTIPSFLILVGPLLLLLWLARRTRETFVAGAATGAAILLLYAPVLRQLIAAFTEFHADKDETEFNSITTLWRAVRLYLQPCDNWQAATLLALLLLTPFAFARWRPRGERLGPCLVAAACGIYFATLIYLRTPPLRMAACGVLPAAFVGILAIGGWMRAVLPVAVRATGFAAVAVAMLFSGIHAIRGFDFVPTENWTLAARVLDEAFPRSMKIDYARYAKYLGRVSDGIEKRGVDFDAQAFADGRLVVADAGNKWAEGSRFTPPGGLSDVVAWRIFARIRDVVLTFRLPANADVTNNALRPGTRLPTEPSAIEVTPPPGARALVILLNRPVNDRELSLEAAKGAFLAGNAVVVPINDSTPAPIKVTLHPRVNDLTISRAWIFPQ